MMILVRLVTVNHQSYWVYRYEGALNDLDNAVVLFSWHKDAQGLSFTRKEVKANLFAWIYKQSQSGVPLSHVLV